MLDIYDEFRSLVAALDEHEIEYALCGGMAMAVHRRPRMTIDIDILIQSESLERVTTIATDLDYKIRGMDMSFAKGAVEIRRVSKIDPDSGDSALARHALGNTPASRGVGCSRAMRMGRWNIFSGLARRSDCFEATSRQRSGSRRHKDLKGRKCRWIRLICPPKQSLRV